MSVNHYLKYLLLIVIMIVGTSFRCFAHGDIPYDDVIRAVYDSLEMVRKPEIKKFDVNTEGKEFIIHVRSQNGFECLSQTLKDELKEGHKNITVKIKRGTYYFTEGLLTLSDLHYPGTFIQIEGKNVTIVPKGWKLKNGDNIPCDVSGETCYVDLVRRQNVSTWGEMMYADSLIETIDVATKRCRLKCEKLGDLYVPEGNMAYLDLTRWCRCYQYKVIKIENGYVDFYAHDLQMDSVFHKPYYNVNYDYVYAKMNPRFRLSNATGKENVSVINGKVRLNSPNRSVYLGNAGIFMTVQHCEFRGLRIKGLTFLGSKQDYKQMINLAYVNAKVIEFSNCRFIGQRNRILTAHYADNLFFHDNYVTENAEIGLLSEQTSRNTVITDNVFENNGLDLSCNRCIICCGTDFYVGHNRFKNFGYCAVSMGVWYGTKMIKPNSGIVEYNEMWYDKEHFDNAWKYTIMDGGAIYVATQTAGVIIRYNYIHDYTGMRQNRGIYLDDGAHHVSVYGNIVLNIPNMHAIDSRLVPGTENRVKKNSFSVFNNINNFMAYNFTDGTLNFVGREQKYNGCKMGENIILCKNGKRPIIKHGYKVERKNLEMNLQNVEMEYLGYNEKGIVVPDEVMTKIKEYPCYEKIKKWVRQ